MMGKPSQLAPKLFYHGISLDSRMPQGHPLRKIEQLVKFNFVRSRICANSCVISAAALLCRHTILHLLCVYWVMFWHIGRHCRQL